MQNVTVKNRLTTVDALRGCALLGIMLAHFMYWYTAGPLLGEYYGKYQDIGTAIVNWFDNIFITGKFFTFFSFLFGLSFYLQMRGLEHDPSTFVKRFAWRLILLLVIGLIHHALWRGDILSIYAPLGFILLAMRKLSNKWVLILGILFAVNVPARMKDIPALFVKPVTQNVSNNNGNNNDDPEAKAYTNVIAKGSWWDILKSNMQNLSTKFDFQFSSGRIYITLGFFLLGMYSGRKRWFEKGAEAKPIFRKICARSSIVMGCLLLAAIGLIVADAMMDHKLQQIQALGLLFQTIYDTFNAFMVVTIISGLTLIMFRRGGAKVLHPLAPVGKMALTSYIMQTLFGLLLFYHVGVGLFGKTSPGLNYLIAIAFFFCQMLFSTWWLKHFYYGPIEWFWRSGTLLKWQPMLKRSSKDEDDVRFIPEEKVQPIT